MYDELINKLRIGAKCFPGYELYGYAKEPFRLMPEHLTQAADAIEDLQDKVKRAVWFYDSAELAEAMRKLNEFLPDVSDPEWQKAHMDMGFYSPIGEIYKEMGLYDETQKDGDG